MERLDSQTAWTFLWPFLWFRSEWAQVQTITSFEYRARPSCLSQVHLGLIHISSMRREISHTCTRRKGALPGSATLPFESKGMCSEASRFVLRSRWTFEHPRAMRGVYSDRGLRESNRSLLSPPAGGSRRT